MKQTAKTLEELDTEYRQRKAEIRADEGLSWERKKELSIRQLGDEYYRRRRQLEEAAA